MNFEAYVVRFSGTGKSKTAPYMGESLSGFGYVRMRIKVTHIGRRMRRPAPALVTKTAAQKDARQIKTPAKKVDNLPPSLLTYHSALCYNLLRSSDRSPDGE